MELDAPKPQDLSKIMADIRAQYDELAQKNREELNKYWSRQIEESTTVVTSQTAEIGAAEMTLTELRRTVQSLEIDLDSMRNLVRTLSSFHWKQLFLPLHFPLLLPTSLVPGK